MRPVQLLGMARGEREAHRALVDGPIPPSTREGARHVRGFLKMQTQIDLIPTFHRHPVRDATPMGKYLCFVAELTLIVLLLSVMFIRDRTVVVAVCILTGLVVAAAEMPEFIFKRRSRSRVRVDASHRADGGNTTTGRLVCRGEPIELKRLARLCTELTIPSVFRDTGAGALLRISSRSAHGLPKIAGILAMAGLVFYCVSDNPLFLLCAMVFFKWGWDRALALWKGRYYRIVPGRLEILRFGLLRAKAKTRTLISLHDVNIVCRYDKQRLEISPSGTAEGTQHQPEGVATIHLETLDEPHAFVEAVFQGAICSCAAPELPADELLG